MPAAPITSAVPGQFRRSAVSVVLFVNVAPQAIAGAPALAVPAPRHRQPPHASASRYVRAEPLMTDPPVAVPMRRSCERALPAGYPVATAAPTRHRRAPDARRPRPRL